MAQAPRKLIELPLLTSVETGDLLAVGDVSTDASNPVNKRSPVLNVMAPVIGSLGAYQTVSAWLSAISVVVGGGFSLTSAPVSTNDTTIPVDDGSLFADGLTVGYTRTDAVYEERTITVSGNNLTVAAVGGDIADNSPVFIVPSALLASTVPHGVAITPTLPDLIHWAGGRIHNIEAYGADLMSADNSAAFQEAATAAEANRGMVWIPEGVWDVQAVTVLNDDIIIAGTRGSVIRNTGTSKTFEFRGTSAFEVVFQDFQIHGLAGSGDMLYAANTSGQSGYGIKNSAFINMFFSQKSLNARIVEVDFTEIGIGHTGRAFQNTVFLNCVLKVEKGSTVSAVRFRADASRFSNTGFKSGEFHAHGASAAPFCEWTCTAQGGTYFYGMYLEDLITEQTLGGVLHAKSHYGLRVEDIDIWDSSFITTTTTGNIDNITNASPPVITTDGSHNRVNGERVRFADTGTTLNGLDRYVVNATSNTFEAASSATIILSENWKWIRSSSGTNEYYVANGSFVVATTAEPASVAEFNGTSWDFYAKGSLGSLATSEWAWGNNDGLATDTIYVRISTDTHPGTLGMGYLRKYGASAAPGVGSGGTWTKLQDATGSMIKLDAAVGGIGGDTGGTEQSAAGLTTANARVIRVNRYDNMSVHFSGTYDIELASANGTYIEGCTGNQSSGIVHNINNKAALIISRGQQTEVTYAKRLYNSVVLGTSGFQRSIGINTTSAAGHALTIRGDRQESAKLILAERYDGTDMLTLESNSLGISQLILPTITQSFGGVSPGPRIQIGRNSTQDAPGTLALVDRSGTIHYMFIGDGGRLHVSTVAPDTDGDDEGYRVVPSGYTGRFHLEWIAGARGKPGINGDIRNASETIRMVTDPHFELQGVNASSDDATFHAAGGVVIDTDNAVGDQVILVPHQTANQSPWSSTNWPTTKELVWECHFIQGATITNMIVWAGLKLTSTPDPSTDANSVYFRYQDTVNSGRWQAIHRISSGTPEEYDTGIVSSGATTRNFKIVIGSDIKARMYINGTKVRTTGVLAGVNLVPFIGVETATSTGARNIVLLYQSISRLR